MKIKLIITVSIIILFAFFMNVLYSQLGVEYFKWLLAPTTFIVEKYIGENALWVNNVGYKIQNMPIVIEKSCSGFRYLSVMVGLTALYLLLLKVKFSEHWKKLIFLPIFIFAYVIGINSFRIITSIGIEKFAFKYAWFPNHAAHELLGILYFLLGLFSIYYLVNKLIHLNTTSWKF